MISAVDHEYMARALVLAKRGLYTTDPNPRVGCVLVRGHNIVGEGWHKRAGELHAERLALEQAGEAAQGATAYVTLEPCSHFGRTPPCADALVAAGVVRVVIAAQDPNPKVSGQGIERLRQAGVQVDVGLMERQARLLNIGFYSRMQRGRPWVRCKLATSLDGRTAMSDGESKWITSAASRHDVQLLRARSSAIVTGLGTIQADDPQLNVRLEHRELPGVENISYLRQPIRVVADPALRTRPNARLLESPGPVLIAGVRPDSQRGQALQAAGAEVWDCPGDQSGNVDLRWLMARLARTMECNEVLIESGRTLAGAAMQAGLIDELIVYMAPHLMGDSARGMLHLKGVEQMSDRIQLKLLEVRQIGPDLRLSYVPVRDKKVKACLPE